MIEITTLPSFEDMVSLSDVAPVLGMYALCLSALGAYLYRRLKQTPRSYPFVFFEVVGGKKHGFVALPKKD